MNIKTTFGWDVVKRGAILLFGVLFTSVGKKKLTFPSKIDLSPVKRSEKFCNQLCFLAISVLMFTKRVSVFNPVIGQLSPVANSHWFILTMCSFLAIE